MKFSEFGFEANLMEGLDAMGFENATPVQEKAIPIIMQDKDLIACAQTGTGKTGAFLLPILNKLILEQGNYINTLIIVPTRELAIQIDQQLEGFAYFAPVGSIPVYGGGDGAGWDQQKKALVKGADIVIATPGRLLSHINMGYVKLDKVKHLVLDEADRMLDMGFNEDIMRIISHLPKKRQSLLFSATMPSKIRELANKILHQPEQVNLAISKPAEGVLQAAYLVYDAQKAGLTKLLLKDKELTSVIIFSSTKEKVRSLARELRHMGFKAAAISSDLEQKERENVLLDFRNRKLQILVATDVLSRGIDIKDINLVINYDVPKDAADYVHRVGRTARADKTGAAITFINDRDQRDFDDIEKLIETVVHKVPLPTELGEGPVYDPTKKVDKPTGRGGNRNGHKGGNRNGGGGPKGNRPHNNGGKSRYKGNKPRGNNGGGHNTAKSSQQ